MRLDEFLLEIKKCQEYSPRNGLAIELGEYILQLEPSVKVFTKQEFRKKENEAIEKAKRKKRR